MSESYTCRQGHRWQAEAGETLPSAGADVRCPLCGGPAQPTAPQHVPDFSTLPRPGVSPDPVVDLTSLPPPGLPSDSAVDLAVRPPPGESLGPDLDLSSLLGPTSAPDVDVAPPPELEETESAAEDGPAKAPLGTVDTQSPTREAPPEPLRLQTRDLPTPHRPRFSPTRTRTPTIPGYEILKVLGHGGMGVVFQARQLSLNRLVAVKMILAGAHASPTQLARFHIEAEALANLQHPNIVQVHEVGEHDGCPYIALELVDGGSLDQQLADQLQPARPAAQLVATLARAMHCAHLRGIVHRDLKPANVLLTREGVPKITDFGLAKRLEEEQSHTKSGAIMGTPQYMAPEQATGRTRDVTPAADVYALGAILYEMLTGQPPFQGETTLAILDRVRKMEPTPPSRLQPRIPRDLETICLKCLHKQPGKRYASAEALADDLGHFLNDEPILARRVGRAERIVKWARRRPTLAALLAVIVVAGLSLLALGAWSYVEVTASAREAQQERRRAETRSRDARQAVDDMYTQVADRLLDDTPQQSGLQREFLEKALRLYQQFAQEESHDPAIRRETGLAYFRVGQIYRKLDQPEQAERAYRSALALQEELSRAYPGDPVYRQDLANSSNWMGELLRASGRRLDEAEAAYRTARRLQEELVAQVGGEPAYQLELARSYYNLGILQMDTGRPREAEKDYDMAIRLLERLVKDHPRVPDYQQELARSDANRGILLRADPARLRDAERDYDRAIALYDGLVKQHPHRREYRYELAVSHINRGNLLLRNEQRRAAVEGDYRAALALLDRLVKEFPTIPRYRYELANCHNSLAGLFSFQKNFPAAEQEWLQALPLFEELAARPAAGADYRSGLGMTLGNLGWLCLQRQKYTAARGYLEKGIAQMEEALEPNPENPNYLQALRNQYRDLVEVLLKLDDHAAAAARAAYLPRILKDRDADYFLAARYLARCLPLAENDARIATEIERRQLARKYADEAVGLLREGVTRNPRGLEPLRNHPELKPLAQHREFIELLEHKPGGK